MNNNNKAKQLGLLGLVLCGLCCALPVIGAAIGMASLTGIAFYLEKAGIATIGLAAFFIWFAWYAKHKAAKNLKPCSCTSTCGCKTENIAQH